MEQRRDFKSQIESLFNARSVAVVGVSDDGNKILSFGTKFWETLKDFGYEGALYPVGVKGGKIRGVEISRNIKDIHGPVDFVICAIPNKYTPQLLEDCGQKGVKGVHMFTAGFGEAEEKIGEELEKQLLQIARKYNMLLLGPNCMGIYYPAKRLTFSGRFSKQSGHVGFISQSGGQTHSTIMEANNRGIYFSKALSYGNATDVNECDLLEYFSNDPDTGIIVAYIEGTRDGRRLFRLLKETSSRKPVVIFKCGATESGQNAALSHTSSIAGSNTNWDALLRQTGVIRVDNAQEMFDAVTILQRCPRPMGLNALIMGHGGGSCVQASDDASRAGLRMPLLPDRMRQKLAEIYGSDTGRIFKNPLDISSLDGRWDLTFAVLEQWGEIDLYILNATPEQLPFADREFAFQFDIDSFIQRNSFTKKPLLAVLNVSTVEDEDGVAERNYKRLINAGVATFSTIQRAATAYKRVYQYYQWLHNIT